MKQAFTLFFLVAMVQVFGQSLSVMTYNIRLDTESDGENKWANRKEFLMNQIKFYDPEVFGVQEALPNQMNDLSFTLPEYSHIGVGRDDGKRKGEFSSLFYKTDRFELLDSGTFWLAEQTDFPNKAWDAALPRICTWGLFRVRGSQKEVLIMNTHFDHVGEVARQKSLELIEQKAIELNPNKAPVIVMGDLNLEPQSKPIQYFQTKMEDSRLVADRLVFGPEGTFNGWNLQKEITRRIDYIFLSKDDFVVHNYAVISDRLNQKYASDHLPVYIEIEFKNCTKSY